MLRFKKLRIIVILIALLFFLSSCTTKKEISYLGVSKVEVTCNLFYEVPHLEISIFSTQDYSSLKIANNNYIDKVSGYTQEITLIMDSEQISGYLHLFDITFKKEEFLFQEITLIHKGQELKTSIGMFQTIMLEPSTLDINSSIDIYQGDHLTGLIHFRNDLYKPIYLLNQKVVTLNKRQQFSLLNSTDKVVIYAGGIKNFDLFTIKMKEKYHQVGGIIQTKFRTNLEEYMTYTTYYYSSLPDVKKLITEGINVDILEEIKVT